MFLGFFLLKLFCFFLFWEFEFLGVVLFVGYVVMLISDVGLWFLIVLLFFLMMWICLLVMMGVVLYLWVRDLGLFFV